MPGKDSTGTYDTKDYVLGRGKIYLSELDENGLPKVWRDIGNVPTFNITVAEEELEHFTTREGLKIKDRTVTLSKDVSFTFSMDTINDENFALFFSGETVDYTNPAIAGFTQWQIIGDDEIQAPANLVWYEIKDSSNNRAYGIDSADLALETTEAVPVPLVEGTDYEVEPIGGMFRLLESTAVATARGTSDGVNITLAANAGAKNVDEVRALTMDTQTYAMKFLMENPANDDEKTEFQFHQTKIRADGDLAAISEEWQEMPMSGSAEANAAASPDSPTLTMRTLKAA